jgi:hypothetical protein
MVLMANLLPGTPEEAVAYIPSLQVRGGRGWVGGWVSGRGV